MACVVLDDASLIGTFEKGSADNGLSFCYPSGLPLRSRVGISSTR
jgi:hypothetical protein